MFHVIDDLPELRGVLKELIECAGYACMQFGSAESYLEYFNSPEYLNLKESYKHIDVKINLADDLLNISGSPVHILKVVMNLVSNGMYILSK